MDNNHINQLKITQNKENIDNNPNLYTIVYQGNTEETIYNAKQYASIFKELFDDYELGNDNDENTKQQKNILYKTLFLGNKEANDNKKYELDYYNTDNKNFITIKYNNEIYFPNGKMNLLDEREVEYLSIFFDYKENKNKEINSLFDIMETSIYSYSEENKDDDEKYIQWKTLDGKILDFKFENIGFTFHNKLNIRLNIKIHIIPVLEEKEYCLEANSYQHGSFDDNKAFLYQIKNHWM